MKPLQIITAVIIFVVTSNALLSMDITQIRPKNKTLLWISELAKEKPNLETIKQIVLQTAVDVNIAAVVIQKNEVITKYAILEAAKQRDWGLVNVLLKAGANPKVTTELKQSVVRCAIYAGNIDMLTKLILAGVPTNVKDHRGETDEDAALLFGINLSTLREKN